MITKNSFMLFHNSFCHNSFTMFFNQLKRHVGLIMFVFIGYILCVFLMKSAFVITETPNDSKLQMIPKAENIKPLNSSDKLRNFQKNSTILTLVDKLAISVGKITAKVAQVANLVTSGANVVKNESNLFSNITIPEGVTCGIKASFAGSHQKVISYTIYGNQANYWRGLPEILIQARILYTGWFIRVYTDNPNFELLRNLTKEFSYLHICDANNLPPPKTTLKDYPAMMWRYFPLGDPQIDIIIFRDSDSQLLAREHDAVMEWLERTTKSLHMMRDHPYHGTEILGGMWGARITPVNRDKWKQMRDILFSNSHKSTQTRQLDQSLLRTVVWPAFDHDFVAHDSYTCRSYPGSIAFPTRRMKDAFVGAQYYSYYGYGTLYECPAECRPPNHKDWIHC